MMSAMHENRKYSYQQLDDTLPAAELPVAPLRRSFRSFSSCRGPALRQAPSRAPSTGWSSCTALHKVQLSQLQFLRPFKMISASVFSLFFISSHHSLTLDLQARPARQLDQNLALQLALQLSLPQSTSNLRSTGAAQLHSQRLHMRSGVHILVK